MDRLKKSLLAALFAAVTALLLVPSQNGQQTVTQIAPIQQITQPSISVQITDEEVSKVLNELQSTIENQQNKLDQQTKTNLTNETNTKKFIAAAGSIAVFLKLLLSILKDCQPYFDTESGKKWIKIITVVVGLLTYFVSNIACGAPWYQAVILSLGGPAAILVNEFAKSIVINKPTANATTQPKTNAKPAA
jgi:hypothetical protein